MSDDPASGLSPEESDAQREHLERKVGIYSHFLLERGIDLYYSEPEPDFDDYVGWFLRDPPPHLVGADELELIQFAAEGWLATQAARSDRMTEAVNHTLKVHFLAALRTMADEIDTTTDDHTKITEAADQLRKTAIYSLWSHQIWREPWISLVDQEFPGADPTAADIEQFEVQQAHDREVSAEREAATRAFYEEMELFMVAQSFVPADVDDRLLTLLSIQHAIFEVRSGFSKSMALEARLSLLDWIKAKSSEPDHPAWQALLDEYFPITE